MSTDNPDDLIISISTDQATLRRSIQRIERDIAGLAGGVQRSFVPVGKAIEDAISTPLQQRINTMIGIGTKASREWSGALADQGAELDRLRAKYNPLFRTIDQYKAAQADIRTLYRSGKIDMDEYTAAMGRERTAALASIAAIKGRNQALADTPVSGTLDRNAAFRRQNLGYQAFDIGQGLASGLPLGLIAAQQGPQIAQLYAGQGGIKAMLSDIAGLAAGAARALGPIGIALSAAGAAATAYFFSTRDAAEVSNEALNRHVEAIQAAAQAWGDALPSLKAFADQQDRVAKLQAGKEGTEAFVQQTLTGLPEKIVALREQLSNALPPMDLTNQDTGKYLTLQTLLTDLSDHTKGASASLSELNDVQMAVTAAIGANATPALKSWVDQWLNLTLAMRNALEEAKRAREAFYTAVSGGTNVQDIVAGNTFRDERGNIQYTRTFTPTNPPLPQDRPEDADAAGSAANEKAAHAYRDLIKSADDRIGQLKLETELLGKFGIEADTARFKLELLQQSEDKGRTLSPEQRKELEQKVELFRQYSETLAKVKLQQDLMEDLRLSSLSPQDRQIAATLKQYGLPGDDLNSPQAQQIRQSLQYGEVKDSVKGFLTDLENGLTSNGFDIGKALGQAILNAANREMQKSLDALFDKLAGAVANAFVGGKIPGGTAASGGLTAAIVNGVRPDVIAGKIVNNRATNAASTDIEAYIRQAAMQRGIDPDVAVQVAKAEGGLRSWNMQSRAIDPKTGQVEQSFGPFQLYKNGGLGNEFQRQTGLDPALAQNGPAGVNFALDHVRKYGWTDFHGAANVGISKWQGVGTPGVDQTTTSSVTRFSASLDNASKDVGAFGGSLGTIGQKIAGNAGGFNWASLFSSSWKPNTTYSQFIGLAGGGVYGPGGSTDDRIPAWLSNGEFVVNAEMTRKHRAMLEAINSGKMARFAGGGFVAPTLVPVPVAPTLMQVNAGNAANGNQPVPLHVHIHGASGDDHVRTLVNQGVGQALSDYDKNQERGGFGSMQNRWAIRKA